MGDVVSLEMKEIVFAIGSVKTNNISGDTHPLFVFESAAHDYLDSLDDKSLGIIPVTICLGRYL